MTRTSTVGATSFLFLIASAWASIALQVAGTAVVTISESLNRSGRGAATSELRDHLNDEGLATGLFVVLLFFFAPHALSFFCLPFGRAVNYAGVEIGYSFIVVCLIRFTLLFGHVSTLFGHC
jgi:hypothetical protein